MGERHNGHVETKLTQPVIEFSGGRKDGWHVIINNPDGTPASRKPATTAQIIAGNLYASLIHGRPSVAYTIPKTGQIDVLRVEGTARLAATFPPGTKATKHLTPDGATRIYPVYTRRTKKIQNKVS